MNMRASLTRAAALVSLAASLVLSACGGAAQCPAGESRCATLCVDEKTDRANCGACGNACGAGTVCSAGACVVSCQPGLEVCSASCRDLQTDRANCGGCGVACKAGEVCSAGSCAVSCQAALSNCAGSCRDLQTDAANCGACGSACPAGEGCAAGHCGCPGAAPNLCGAGASARCTDKLTDTRNCGACGNACPAGQQCNGGACGCPAATPDACTGAGGAFCTNLHADANNCSACGSACPAGQSCVAGSCACAPGEAACSTAAGGTGCFDLSSDQVNCGACGTGCGIGAQCTAGLCCAPNLTGCGTACADLTRDTANCGACGHVCPAGGSCTGASGAVRATFSSAAAAAPDPCTCPGVKPGSCGAAPGTCVDFDSDVNNCNGCGLACPTPGQVCRGAACACPGTTPSVCSGACVDLDSDANHCGLCGTACGTGLACAGGQCRPVYLSCLDAKTKNPSAADGLYLIRPPGKSAFNVYCDMTDDGGGWEVLAYIRKPSQWSTALATDSGVVGDLANGFFQAQTLLGAGGVFQDKLVAYLNLEEDLTTGGANLTSLGRQWMVDHQQSPIALSNLEISTGYTYYDSFHYADPVDDACTHGCGSYRTFGMFHGYQSSFGYCGTQGGDNGCRDGNNICWMPRGLGCNVGQARCAYLTGTGEGVIYAVREASPPLPFNGVPVLGSSGHVGAVDLQWTPADDSTSPRPVGGYRIYRGVAAGAETLLATVGNVSAYKDSTVSLTTGATYFYQVSAVDAAGSEGAKSNEISVTPTCGGTTPGICGGACVDLANDLNHCGSCSTVCGAGQGCNNGACAAINLSCLDAKNKNPAAADGVYLVQPAGKPLLHVYCDMTDDGGGWEVLAYIRSSSQWDTPLLTDSGTVGDTAHGFFSASSLSSEGITFQDKIVVYLNLEEDLTSGSAGLTSLGRQWMVDHQQAPLPIASLATATGYTYYDSFRYTDPVSSACSHGCGTYRTFGMFHDSVGSFSYCGTQGGDNGCRDGNNICWAPRGLGCNAGQYRCAYLTGTNEGVLYGVREATVPQPFNGVSTLSSTSTAGEVDLSWTSAADATSRGLAGYRLYRGAAGAETLLTSLGATTLTYKDLTVAAGGAISYRVSAVDAVGTEGAKSNELTVTPTAVPSSAVRALAVHVSATSVALSWQAPGFSGASAITGYNVYRGTAAGAETLLTTVTATGFTDSSLASGTALYYQVTAVNGAGESPRSGEFPAVPGAPLASCAAIQAAAVAASVTLPDGYYSIQPGATAFTAYCDMTTLGGGWTLVVNRIPFSDATGVPDLNASVGDSGGTRDANFVVNLAGLYGTALDAVYATRFGNNRCEGKNISCYSDAAMRLSLNPSTSKVYTPACTAATSPAVAGTKLQGAGAVASVTGYLCGDSLGWGNCSNNLCHLGSNSTNTNAEGQWSQNRFWEIHVPGKRSSYAAHPSCRTCNGGTSYCCGSDQNSGEVFTLWLR